MVRPQGAYVSCSPDQSNADTSPLGKNEGAGCGVQLPPVSISGGRVSALGGFGGVRARAVPRRVPSGILVAQPLSLASWASLRFCELPTPINKNTKMSSVVRSCKPFFIGQIREQHIASTKAQMVNNSDAYSLNSAVQVLTQPKTIYK